MFLRGLSLISTAVATATVVLTCAVAHYGQIGKVPFEKILTERAAFSPDEIGRLRGGETLVKTLPGDGEKQVSVVGVVRIRPGREITMSEFRKSLSAKGNKSKLGSGDFSVPPVPDDLTALELRDDDVEDLRKCIVGKCDIKLPAAMIKSLPTQIEWNAPDAKGQAARWYRRMLADYVADYAKRGDRALMQYDSRKTPVRLAEDYRKLLDESFFVNELVPEFAEYLRGFPSAELSDVENTINWTTFSFGLDPVVSVTHSAYFFRPADGGPLYAAAAKQIYGSRYIDSTLAITLLVSVAGNDGIENYIVFTDVSRSGVLDGPFSGTKRDMVEREAVTKVAGILDLAKQRLELAPDVNPAANVQAADYGLAARIWSLGQRWDVRILLIALLGVIGFLIYRELKTS